MVNYGQSVVVLTTITMQWPWSNDGHFMVDEPVKTIIDHGQKMNSTIIDHELTMTNYSQSVVALTTMTMVINDGLNEWVDHGQPWLEYWLWLLLTASDLLT